MPASTKNLDQQYLDTGGANALSWQEDAACRGQDVTRFFAPGVNAAAICDGCPVIEACLRYALERPWITGVWGGTTKYQRTLKRRGTVRHKRTHCKRGHEFSEDNTRVNQSNGQRVCLTCERDRTRKARTA